MAADAEFYKLAEYCLGAAPAALKDRLSQRIEDEIESWLGTDLDPECYNLAKHILGNAAPEGLKHRLAQRIQDAIENWLLTVPAGANERFGIHYPGVPDFCSVPESGAD